MDYGRKAKERKTKKVKTEIKDKEKGRQTIMV